MKPNRSETTKRPPRFAVLIPAYNEARRITKILQIITQVSMVSEIIVVDDGSSDETWKLLVAGEKLDPRIRIIHHPFNLGKGQAVFSGLELARAHSILTLDADLVGLKPEHLRLLAEPVMNGSVDMTLGIFRGGKIYTDFSHWITPWLTGQRCLKAELFHEICWEAASGYGLETAITIASQKGHWRSKRVLWQGVSHPPSEGHRGILGGARNRIKMYAQIVRALIITHKYYSLKTKFPVSE